MDLVFKALADSSRRLLLDNLFARDGQTLGELGARLEMTRFGAMKHLRVLERAGLVTTRKVGREKLHYLNPLPIQEIHERWVSKYAAPWLSAMSAIKSELEGESGRDRQSQAPTRDRRAASGHAQIKRRIKK
jgi:DNA-binding transcriptional ArsR family regulator